MLVVNLSIVARRYSDLPRTKPSIREDFLIEPIYLYERVCFSVGTDSMAVQGSDLRLVADEKVRSGSNPEVCSGKQITS